MAARRRVQPRPDLLPAPAGMREAFTVRGWQDRLGLIHTVVPAGDTRPKNSEILRLALTPLPFCLEGVSSAPLQSALHELTGATRSRQPFPVSAR